MAGQKGLAMADQIPTHLYGVAAFLTVSRLMEKLVDKGMLTQQERADIWALTAGGLSPASDPGVKAMRAMLQSLSGGSGPTQ